MGGKHPPGFRWPCPSCRCRCSAFASLDTFQKLRGKMPKGRSRWDERVFCRGERFFFWGGIFRGRFFYLVYWEHHGFLEFFFLGEMIGWTWEVFFFLSFLIGTPWVFGKGIFFWPTKQRGGLAKLFFLLRKLGMVKWLHNFAKRKNLVTSVQVGHRMTSDIMETSWKHPLFHSTSWFN